jgi:hypothetical protein
MSIKSYIRYRRELAVLSEEREGFFPAAPCLESQVMRRLGLPGLENSEAPISGLEEAADFPCVGFSFRGWVIAGCFILLSMATAFFGSDFVKIAGIEGSSFLLPVGITFGVVLTCYCALFIGSHMRELEERFHKKFA